MQDAMRTYLELATGLTDASRKKFVSSCTSCNSMNANGLRAPKRAGRRNAISR